LDEKIEKSVRFELGACCLHIPVGDVDSFLKHIGAEDKADID
jgi:hypothetical protein